MKDGATTPAAGAGKVYLGVTLAGSRICGRAYHAPGRLTTSLKLEPRAAPLGKDKGYQHVTGVARGKIGGAWWVRWDAGGASLTLRFEATPGTEVITGVGPGRDPSDKVPMVVVRRRAAKTVFAAVHEMVR